MSLAWFMLVGLLIVERNTFGALATASPHYGLRSALHKTIKASDVEHRRSRRIMRITGLDKGGLSPKKVQHVDTLNTTISTPERKQYNMWQVLKADGQANFYVLFFTIYISYLVYVLF
ncbi:uncharacterized protein LOC108042241 [Drosophila rhopaloa]|uniref:Uncharacterized protein LOC108042241 n=1 Tax=Drosophila rhopaloa TaxID=1041015 RepID=A0A6P4ECW8_DRORH|nr:uncharacterized protein LOC108042241 [Drosophila rhopaloa]